jgi:hypothetical protein
VVDAIKARRGRFPTNASKVLEELQFRKSSFLQARDPWGEPYQLRYEASRYRSFYELRVVSSGRDRTFGKSNSGDDVTLFRLDRDWFAEARESIRKALDGRFLATREFPANEEEFVALLNSWKINFQNLRDPWGQPLRLNFLETQRYGTRTRIEKVAAMPNAPAVEKTIVEPVTRHIRRIQIGVALKPGFATLITGVKEPLNFSVAAYEQVVAEESRDDAVKEKNASDDEDQASGPRLTTTQREQIVPKGLAGAIAGIVRDPNGGVVIDAKVTLTNSATIPRKLQSMSCEPSLPHQTAKTWHRQQQGLQ